MPVVSDNGTPRQVNMENALNAAAMMNMRGFYNDATYYGIKMWIEAYMSMENAPMPSGVLFISPVFNRRVSFLELCRDLDNNWRETEGLTDNDETDTEDIETMMMMYDNLSDVTLDETELSSFDGEQEFTPAMFQDNE